MNAGKNGKKAKNGSSRVKYGREGFGNSCGTSIMNPSRKRRVDKVKGEKKFTAVVSLQRGKRHR